MKKILLRLAAAAIILSLGVTGVFAAGPGCGRHFVDEDADGVCDNAGSACAYVDEDGDGVCDICGTAHGSCAGSAFLDEDGDGICDNYTSSRGLGCGYGCGARGGHGKGFRCGRGR